MKKFCLLLTVCAMAHLSVAAWYWPFGDDEEKKQPRVSELMEPASLLIDEAADFVEAGKIPEAVDAYKRALKELDRIEAENADRAQTAAFATLRNKRAYVNAAIDSLHLKEAKENARAVAVTDTTELEKKFAKKKGLTLPEEPKKEKAATIEPKLETTPKPTPKPMSEPKVEPKTPQERESPQPLDRRGRLMLAAEDMKKKDFPAALLTIAALLDEKPNDAAALNLRAAVESETGDFKKAERTLDQAIRSNPRSYYAYYNMARLFLRSRGGEGKAAAKRYYETGRTFGGGVDAGLEAALK